MCGIVGYIGNKRALPIVLSGLERLEYRGYDSFGFCVLGKDKFLYKETGKISKAKEVGDFDWDGTIGISHTRWATTGEVTKENAHPHCDCKEEIFVVHNGIIENYKQLKEKLVK
ncbi:MAG: class II glutamine amidotransferase, partial [Candidatus Pacebacteria bacterium]|nr:class II glutamine amidotransferase [Candidatus Paceibacterota bacterium]